jgi:hypothetical protein
MFLLRTSLYVSKFRRRKESEEQTIGNVNASVDLNVDRA